MAADEDESDGSAGGKGLVGRLLGKWLPKDTVAPGRERIVSSPLVVGLLGLLVVLVGLGFWLKSIIATTIAERTFKRGLQDFEDGDYRTAIRDFDGFIASNPEERRVPKARVIGRWPTSGNTSRPTPRPGPRRWRPPGRCTRSSPGASIRVDGIPRRTQRAGRPGDPDRRGAGRSARATADPKALAEAESAVPLHAQVAGESARRSSPGRGCRRSWPRPGPPSRNRRYAPRRWRRWTPP